MALSPDVTLPTGQVSTAPDTRAPDDYLNVEPKAGAALADAGQQAVKLGQFFGQVQTTDMLNQANDQAGQVLNDFLKLRGQDALNAQASTQKQISDIFTSAQSNLSSPEQINQFRATAGDYITKYYGRQIAEHGADAQYTYMSGVQAAALDGANRQAAAAANAANPDAALQESLGNARQAAVRQVQLDGNENDPTIVQDAVRNADSGAYAAYIQSLVVRDPNAAMTAYQKYGPYMNADTQTKLRGMVRGAVLPGAVNGIAQGILGTGGSSLPPPASPQAGAQPVNNLMNLRPPGQKTGFMQYPTAQDGLDAGMQQLTLDITPVQQGGHGLNTIASLIGDPIHGWAPATENKTGAYIKNVSAWTGIDPNAPITAADLPKIQAAIVRQEQGASAMSLDDMNANLPMLMDQASAAASAQFPDQPEAGEMAANRVYALVRERTAAQDAAQKANFNIVGSAIQQNGITDPADLIRLGGPIVQAWSSLTAAQQSSALTMMNKNIPGNSTQDSPAAQQAVAYYQGLAVTDPKAFAGTNFQSSDMLNLLTNDQRKALMDQQLSILKGVYNGPSPDQIGSALKTAEPILASAGIFSGDASAWQVGKISDQKRQQNNVLYTQAVGQLTQDITAFQQQNDRLPSADEVTKMTQRLLIRGTVGGKPVDLFQAEQGGRLDPGFTPDIPQTDLAGINRAFYQNYGRYPTQQEAAQIYMSAQTGSGGPSFLPPSSGDVASNLPGGLNFSGIPAAVQPPAPAQPQQLPNYRSVAR